MTGPDVLERLDTSRGGLVLRRHGDVADLLQAESPACEEILDSHLDQVRTLTVEVAPGEPDVVWVARRP